MSPDKMTPPRIQYELESESEPDLYTNMYLTDEEELLSGMGMLSTRLHSKQQSSPTKSGRWKEPTTGDCEDEIGIIIKSMLPSSDFLKNELTRIEKHKETPSTTAGKLGKAQNQPRCPTPVDRAFQRIDKNWRRSPSPRGRPSTPEMSSRLLKKFELRDTEIQHSDIDTTEFLIARLEKLNDQFSNDPKSVCMHRNSVKATLAVLESLTLPTTTPTSESILGLDEDLASTDTESIESEKTPATPSLTESSDIDPDNIIDGDKSSGDEITSSSEQSGVIADWEFWTSLVEDYSINASKTPYLLTAKIRAGIPGRLRGILWQTMCQGRSTYLETMYNQLLLESSPYERIIMRDLPRTFPRLEMFKDENGIGQTRLFNVMRAYSIYDDGVGYCQGLGFLVGPLLMNMPEREAFCVFVRLMEDYDMRSMFTEKMEGLELRLYQLNSLLSSILPDLFRHFQEHGINTGMFASQWFLTLFAYSYPLPLVLRIFDIVFAEGAPETIMRVSLALLKCNQEKLLGMEEFEDIIGFLSSHLFDTFANPTELIKDAMSLSQIITKEKLDSLAQKYTSENNTECKSDKKQKKKGWGWMVKGLSANPQSGTLQSPTNSPGSPNTPSAPVASDPTSETESMRLELHNLKVTTETYITALGQLREDNTHLTSELISIKASKFCIEEENDELRGHICDMELQEERYREEICNKDESISRLEQELVAAKLALAEAESEKEKLNKQLGGLRRLMLGSNVHQALDKPPEISNEATTPTQPTDQFISGVTKKLERQSSTRRSLDGWSWKLPGSINSSPTTPTASNFFIRSPSIPETKEETVVNLEQSSFTSKLTGYFPRGRKAKRNSMATSLTSSPTPQGPLSTVSTPAAGLPPQLPREICSVDQDKAKSLRRREKCVSAIVVMNKDTGELEPWEFR